MLMLLAVLLCAGCAAGAAGSTPSWVPQQDFATETDPQPQLSIPDDGPAAPGSVAPSAPSSGSSAAPSPSASAVDPAVVATHLNQPTGLVVLPDGTALVGERDSGKIFRVQPQAGQPATLVTTLSVDAASGGGLFDLALSPAYSQDGEIFAYLSTATDNRVVQFSLNSPATPVLTGIPRGSQDNEGRLAFDQTGALLIGTGDSGKPALAQSLTSLAGKILRVDDIGQPAPNNPVAGSAIFASGLSTVDGLCVDPATGTRIAISGDAVELITAGSVRPLATLTGSESGGAGCSIASSQILIATTTGRSLLTGPLMAASVGAAPSTPTSLGTLLASLTGLYGRLRTVLAAPDGSIWLTTSNRDGHGSPVPTDDRVIHLDSNQLGSTL
jgi:glucose/arabinose dehydrogenase